MDYALKEKIGKPELFTGRKEELAYFLKWINDIKDEKSPGAKWAKPRCWNGCSISLFSKTTG
jgi:hypothetical protein